MSHSPPVHTPSPNPTNSKRGCGSLIRRVLLGILIFILIAAAILAVEQTIASDRALAANPAPGQLIDVNGRDMHVYCTGEASGSPTVILESGGISYSSSWYWVQRQLEPNARVCSYDRAGNGWSEARDGVRDPLAIVGELHALLEQANIAPPFVLVGHSFGGVINRVYASQYPDDVVGIVLVDTAIPLPASFASDDEFLQWKRENDILQVVLWALVRTGMYRRITESELIGYGYPETVGREMVALRGTNGSFDAYYAEGILARRELADQSREAQQLGDLPLMILWASELPPISDENRAQLYELQAQIATYSTNSIMRVIEGASHGSIIGSETFAQQVTTAILDVIAAIQSGEPLPS